MAVCQFLYEIYSLIAIQLLLMTFIVGYTYNLLNTFRVSGCPTILVSLGVTQLGITYNYG